jgi:glycosyltransferase involved in cell wall biosynthesis
MERLNIAESYTNPLAIYDRAKRAGMSHVTITDHNSIEGCLLLKEHYGDSIIMGVESTVSFPEDQCKVHILIYGFDEQEFREIQKVRKDIYELRDYLKQQDLAHSIAHASYSVQPGKLTPSHLEKLMVLFNVFEVINGGRSRKDNATWHHILKNLNPELMDTLSRKHSLEPFDSTPWIKGFTGGSDDHGSIFIGKTFTQGFGESADIFLDRVRSKQTTAHGRHSDYQSLVFSIYKVVHDSFQSRENSGSSTIVTRLVESLFAEKRMSWTDRMRIGRLKSLAKKRGIDVHTAFFHSAKRLSKREYQSMDEAVRLVHDCASGFSDAFLEHLCASLARDMTSKNLISTVSNLQSSLPALILPAPFLLTLGHLSRNRMLVERLMANLQIEKLKGGSRVLWFTDTLKDLNGVSVTLQEAAQYAHEHSLDLAIATSMDVNKLSGLPPNIINLPNVHEFRLPYYETYSMKIPSLLKSLEMIWQYDPDVIYISTPGPVGALGLLAAKLMQVRNVGFYHTDFASQAEHLVEDESVSAILEWYTRWFYSAMDEIKVPTTRYMDMLETRGFEPKKMSLFQRGIDTDQFKPETAKAAGRTSSLLKDGSDVTLLYVGRVSPDKGLDFLLQAFSRVHKNRPNVRLVIVGDGPGLADLKVKASGEPVHFMGRIPHESLPSIYAHADLFVFPSTTDTFGKVVLEALSCGLPAIVSDVGGPQEIVQHGKTGFVARAVHLADWVEKIEHALTLREKTPGQYRKMRENARAHVLENYNNTGILESLLEGGRSVYTDAEKKIA